MKSPIGTTTGDFVLVFTITYTNSFRLHYNICTRLNQVLPGQAKIKLLLKLFSIGSVFLD